MSERAYSLSDLEQLRRRALMVGCVGLALCVLWGTFVSPVQLFYSYLVAFVFWLGIALGSLAILMLHHLVGGAWGALIQRMLEAATRTLPLLAVLFVPLLFGMGALYSWARPEVVAADALLQHKRGYLNVPFFILRAVMYFAIWLILAQCLNRWSRQHEATSGQPAQGLVHRRMRLLSAPGLGLYALTVTFASIDWVMSLEPQWYSTMYGVLFIVGQALSALAFAIVAVSVLAHTEPVASVATPERFHDLGNLLLAFVMLWAYVGFSQFLIIWSGNLAEEVPWYLSRTRGGWEGMAVFLILFHFALPFVLLLMRGTKRHAYGLSRVATVLCCVHVIDLFWLILPALHPTGLRVHWMDVVAPIGLGGIWLALFVRNMAARSLIPLEDRRLRGATEHV
jgi:hypothetical protein